MPSFSPLGRVRPTVEPDYENFPRGHYRGAGGDQRGTGGSGVALPDVDSQWMTWPGARAAQRRRRHPKNYVPSDHRILEDVVEFLRDHGDIDLERIEIEVSEGDVILRGEVRGRYARFYAEDLASRVPGVRDVVNELKLERWPDGRERGGPTTDVREAGSAPVDPRR
jgi:hypothetical protein